MKILYLMLITSLFSKSSLAFQQDSIVIDFSNHFPEKLHKKISRLNHQIERQSLKYLRQYQVVEKRMITKLINDSTQLKNDYQKLQVKVNHLAGYFKNTKLHIINIAEAKYNPHLDSVYTALKFIGNTVKNPAINATISDIQSLQSNLKYSAQLEEYFTQSQNYLLKLSNTNNPNIISCGKNFNKLTKFLYYYKAQINQYKEIVEQPKKFEKKALELLSQNASFKKYMAEHCVLVDLFQTQRNISGNNLQGLQSKINVESLIKNVTSAGGSNGTKALQSNLELAKSKLNDLKSEIKNGIGKEPNNNFENFKINTQKTKSFLKRLEYGFNVQFEKSSKYLPSASNIGLNIGYKKNDKLSIGIGSSYKVGFGTIHKISLTNQGIGFRSFSDYKIKNQLYISCGYEMNYNSVFKNIEQLKIYNAWQKSALLGMGKKFKVNSKIKYEIKLYYDFLANDHLPNSQPFVFRIGYLK